MSIIIRNMLSSRNIISRLDGRLLDNVIKRCNMIKIDTVPSSEEHPKYETTRDKDEWKYVERLLPSRCIPQPPKNVTETPSGWIPQSPNVQFLPYFVRRTRNHMLPLYIHIRHRGMHRRTVLKNIHGDIWLMAKQLQTYLEFCAQRPVGVRIHEITGMIMILGDHYSNCERWLLNKGM